MGWKNYGEGARSAGSAGSAGPPPHIPRRHWGQRPPKCRSFDMRRGSWARKHVSLRQSESQPGRAMPVTTLSALKDAAIQPPPGRPVQGFDRAHRPQGILVAYVIGLVLLAPSTTSALELGEASIKSGLGQSLVVEIPYRLAGGERITSACVGLAPAEYATDGLPTYSRVSRISVTSTHIQIFDDRSVLEPLISLNVDVHCNDVPHFVRSYQLFVDPPAQIPTILSNGPAVASAETNSAINTAAPVAARLSDATAAIPNETASSAARDSTASAPMPKTARAETSARARGLAGGDLPQGQTYRVVRGDTLSGIAARIAGRPLTISQTVDAIFAANPAAFTRGNPDLIEEGRSLTIPNMTASAALAAPSTPAPADRTAELSAAAPVATVIPAPAPPNEAPVLRADDAPSVAAPVAEQSLPAPAPVVSQPSPATVAAPTRADVTPEAPSSAATRSISTWFAALLAVGVVVFLWAVWAFVRRRRGQQAAAQRGTAQAPPRRRPVELVSRMGVVEGRLPGATPEQETASMRRVEIAPVTDSRAVLRAGLKDLALTIGPTDPVDFNVGAPVAMNEPVDGSANRAPIIDIGAAGDDTVEENAATTRMPDRSEQAIEDEKMTMTIVELDMLRQDYEAEHTLTQQASQALRDAVADLAATKAAHAATAETSTQETPDMSQAETSDAALDAPTARIRAK